MLQVDGLNSVPLSEILYWFVCEEGSLCCTRVELNTPKLSVFKDEDLLKDLHGNRFIIAYVTAT